MLFIFRVLVVGLGLLVGFFFFTALIWKPQGFFFFIQSCPCAANCENRFEGRKSDLNSSQEDPHFYRWGSLKSYNKYFILLYLEA